VFTRLKLHNFKIWKDTGDISLAPVTLLLGANSSGKSSLIQSFLLLRQTALSPNPEVTLNFGVADTNDSVQLGQFNDVLCKHGDDNDIEIEFRWGSSSEQRDTNVYIARYTKDKEGKAAIKLVRLQDKDESYWMHEARHNSYDLSLGSESSKRASSPEFKPQRSVIFPPAALIKLKEHGDRAEKIGLSLIEELSRISYLGPIRQSPQRNYSWSRKMPKTLGDSGELFADAVISSRYIDSDFSAKGDLLEKLGYWLNKMDLADGVEIKKVTNFPLYEILLETNGEQINLRDVGVGVSQVLPVIAAAYIAPPGTIIIVEEPESHLHPLAQALLAELFVEASSTRQVQFIVETHSEHLFRRLQTLVAKEAVDPKNVQMYFVEREGVNARLQDLGLNEFGRVEHWPDKFFGDTTNEIKSQTESLIERKKREAES
jgi:predicted ATPase